MTSPWRLYTQWYQRTWLRTCFPKLDLSHREELAIANEACERIALSGWYRWYLGLVCMLSVVAALAIALVTAEGSLWALAVFAGAAILIAAVLNIVLMLPLAKVRRRTVREVVREMGGDVCTRCGYLLLHGGERDRCPECGAERAAETSKS